MKNLLITLLFISSTLVFGQQKRMLTLEECIDIAVENNLTVQRSKLNLEGAVVNLMQTKGQRYPSLNANGSYGYNWGNSINPATNLFINDRNLTHTLGANTSIPLINGMQVTNSIKQSKIDLEASEFDLLRSVNDISLNTALNYLNVIFNKELLENAKFVLESSQQQLDRTKKLVESGTLPISNQLQLLSQVATNEVSLINAENNLDLSLLTLKQGLLLAGGEEIDIVIPDVEVDESQIEGSSISEVYEIAISNQPEIKSADLRVKSAEIGINVSEGAMYPILNLNGSVGTRYSDAADRARNFFSESETMQETREIGFLTNDPNSTVSTIVVQPLLTGSDSDFSVSEQYNEFFSTTLGVSLRIPIFNGFQTRSGIQRAKIGLQQAEINSIEQRNNLYQTIESSYRNALAAAKTYSASQRQVEALEETFRALENQYNLGASNFTDFQVASNNLFQAKTDLSRAKYDFIFKQKVLEFYQGKQLTF